MPHLNFLSSFSPDSAEELLHNMDSFLEYETIVGLRPKIKNVRNRRLQRTGLNGDKTDLTETGGTNFTMPFPLIAFAGHDISAKNI